MKLILITGPKCKIPKWYYGKAYENYDANQVIWTIVGFHIVVKIGRYIRQVWNMWRGRKTWFDRQWLDAHNLGFRKGYFQRANEESRNKYLLEELRIKLNLPQNFEGYQNEKFN